MQARLLTKSAFHALSPADALGAIGTAFPAVLKAPAPQMLGLPPGQRVVSYSPDGRSAVLADANGRSAILDSVLPLETTDASGTAAPVDLSLVGAAGGFASANPLVPVSYPANLADGIHLGGRGLAVEVVGADGAAGAYRSGDALFYGHVGGVGADTDVILRPDPEGVETFHEIRSDASPESFSMRFTAPGGVTLSRDPTTGAVRVTRGSDALATVSPPEAIDADGESVPVSISTAGDVLTMTVHHRGAGFAYPIQLDPTIDDEFTWLNLDPSQFWNGGVSWHWATADGRFSGYLGALYGASGMNVYNTAGYSLPQWYPSNAGYDSYWYYRHPGPTARVQLVSFGNWYNWTDASVSPSSCVWSGLWDTAAGHFDGSMYLGCVGRGTWGSTHVATSPNPGNMAFTGLMFLGDGYRQGFWSTVGSVGVRLDDSTAPTVDPTVPTSAVDPNTTISFVSHDTGLGLRRIRIDSPDNPSWNGASDESFQNPAGEECRGTPSYGCPPDRTSTTHYGNLKPGASTIRIQVWDKLNNNYTRTWNVYNYSTSYQYGNASGSADNSVDTQDEFNEVVTAIGRAASSSARASLWYGLLPQDRQAYITYLAPGSEENRANYGLRADDAYVRALFADPANQATITDYDAPMTPSEVAAFDPTAPPLAPESSTPDTTTATAAAAATNKWFNRYQAVVDADAHALNSRTGLFGRFDNDCTNFVSQSWHFGGGLSMTKRWRLARGLRINFSFDWFRNPTDSWVNVNAFVDYMVNVRKVATLINADPSNYQTPGTYGDAVEYDWGTGDGWSHLAILAYTPPDGEHLVDQHSTDRLRNTWRYGYLTQYDAQAALAMRTRVVHVLHG